MHGLSHYEALESIHTQVGHFKPIIPKYLLDSKSRGGTKQSMHGLSHYEALESIHTGWKLQADYS